MTGVTTLPFCTVCGRQLSETARYCPACGNPTSEPDEIESFDQELDAAVTVLERLTNAPGAIVLMENPAKARPPFGSDGRPGGLMSYQDRLLILSLLAELFAWMLISMPKWPTARPSCRASGTSSEETSFR